MRALVLVALLATSAPAFAGANSTTSCRDNYYTGYTCKTTTVDTPDVIPPRPLSWRELREAEESRSEAIRKWESFCKPTPTTDAYGVVRLQYARPGCEFGRTE